MKKNRQYAGKVVYIGMAELTDLSGIIEREYQNMSKGQKHIADFITNNYDKAAFMTASRLGENVGVSESTVVRFANSLGYDGYPELQKALQEMVRSRLTSIQRMELTGEWNDREILSKVLKSDMENIRLTLSEIDENTFEEAVNSILSARRVYIMGIRSSASLAALLAYYLDFMLDNVRLLNTSVNDPYEQLIHIDERDVLIGISFPRYSNRTVDAMKFAKCKNARCIAITDSSLSPLAQEAHLSLVAHSNMASFVDSLVAPFSVANALIVAISQKNKNNVARSFSALEQIWNEHNVYVRKEIPPCKSL